MGIICAENDYFRYVYSCEGGEVRARELACFLDTVEGNPFDNSLGAFLKNIQRKMPMLEAVPPTDAVRIMTVHASKGLEFKHVILGNVGKKFDKRDIGGTLLLDSESGLAMKSFDLGEGTADDTSLYLRIKKEKEKKLKEEEMRILYVALTRAKKTLHICGAVKELPQEVCEFPEKAERFVDWLYPHVKDFARLYSREECGNIAAAQSERAVAKEEQRDYDVALKDEIKRYIAPEKRVKNAPSKTTVTAAARVADEDEESGAVSLPFADNERGAEIGSAYHLLMEKIDFYAPFGDEWARLEKEYASECSLVNKQAVEKARKTVAEMSKGKKVYRELPFLANLNASDDGGEILVQGIIDLLIDGENGYTVVDYKSGEINEKYLAAYEKQVSLYAQAVEKLLGKTVKKKYLYSFSSGTLKEIG